VVFGRVAGRHSLEYINSPKPTTTGAGSTTTVKIPLADGGEITITHTTGGGTAVAAEGEKVDVIEWDDASTTEVGKLTAVADGNFGDDEEDDTQAAAAPAAAAAGGQDVALVVGSFFMGDSKRDAEEIVKAFPSESNGLAAPEATAGNDFDFNSLANTKFLVVCTSSMYGNPPKNFWEFYYHLKAASLNDAKPLKGLQHAVYGNGDETYYDTYMNVPRMIDTLLERAGSRRFFARAETGEPHAPCNTDSINAVTWAPAMYKAMLSASASDPAVAWDAHWEGTKPNHHDKVTDWDLKKLAKKFGEPTTVSNFSTPASKL